MHFEASLFVDLCKSYVDALHAGVLQTEKQKQIAERLYAIMTAFAKTGLVAVIDEVTGYQACEGQTRVAWLEIRYKGSYEVYILHLEQDEEAEERY